MLKFGSPSHNMREMNENDVLQARLKLLIIMCSTYIEKYPLGKYRKDAVKKNAAKVLDDTITKNDVFFELKNIKNREIDNETLQEYILNERIKLLAIMAKSFAEGYPLGDIRKKAIKDNLNIVSELIVFNQEVDCINFLKVA